MTQTPRDWQKDIELCTEVSPMVAKNEFIRMSVHWLQEAKTLQDKLKEMAEIIKYEADLADLRGAEIHARELRAMVATLYPDTPAPKEGE